MHSQNLVMTIRTALSVVLLVALSGSEVSASKTDVGVVQHAGIAT